MKKILSAILLLATSFVANAQNLPNSKTRVTLDIDSNLALEIKDFILKYGKSTSLHGTTGVTIINCPKCIKRHMKHHSSLSNGEAKKQKGQK